MHRFGTSAACRALGLGSFFSLLLFALLSGALYHDAATASEYQLPLTVSRDVGALVGICLALAVQKRMPARGLFVSSEVIILLLLTCAMSAAVLLRSSVLFQAPPFDMVIGDAIFGGLLAAFACVWWRALAAVPARELFFDVAWALGGASVIFILVSLLPRGITLLFAGLVAPFCMCICLMAMHVEYIEASMTGDAAARSITAYEEADEAQAATFPRVLTLSVAAAMFVASLLMSLFPVSIYNEASPLFAPLTGSADAPLLGSLSEPAFIGALLLACFSALFGIMVARQKVRLSVICFIGFFSVAIGFVTFPYHAAGGWPIGIAEAGRCIIVVFAFAAVRMYIEGAAQQPAAWNGALLRLVALCVAGMALADLLVVALNLNPWFDYMDFQVRTVFGGVGVLALVALLLGPMPRVYGVVERAMAGPGDAEGQASAEASGAAAADALESAAAADAQQHLADFAQRFHLSPRESEIVGLLSVGRDVPYIEQELVLSKSTVKTHIRHIYEKCGVSSRQALLDLFSTRA